MASRRLLPAFATTLSAHLQRRSLPLPPRRLSTRPPTMSLPTASTIRSASFPDCVTHAETVLLSAGATPDAHHLSLIDALLSTNNGARAFLIALLADERIALADDKLPEAVTHLMHQNAAEVRDLLAKNLVMSAAMMVHYRRAGEDDKLQGSTLTQRRSRSVVKECVGVDDGLRGVLTEMLEGLGGGEGRFEPFLRKWGYDREQRDVAAGGVRFVLGEGE